MHPARGGRASAGPRVAGRWRPGRRPAQRRAFLRGLRASGASLAGTGAWGFVTGLALVKTGLSVGQALGMTLTVFSGTAQLASMPLIAAGAPLAVIALTAALTNLRFLLYGASVARDLRRLPPRVRLLFGYLTTDTGLAAYQYRRGALGDRVQRLSMFAGANLPVWAAWQVGSIAGIFAAGAIGGGADLAFLGVLAVLAMTTSMLRSLAAIAAALAAAVTAWLATGLPFGFGTLSGVLAGVLVALLVEAALESLRPVGPGRDGARRADRSQRGAGR